MDPLTKEAGACPADVVRNLIMVMVNVIASPNFLEELKRTSHFVITRHLQHVIFVLDTTGPLKNQVAFVREVWEHAPPDTVEVKTIYK